MDNASLLSITEHDSDTQKNHSPKPKPTSLLRLTLVLSYLMVLSFIQNGLTTLVIPAELSIFSPHKTALISSTLTGLGALINAFSPFIGHHIDLIGKRKLLILGAFFVTCGECLLILGVYTRPQPGDGGFVLYFVGYLVTQCGSVMLSTCFNVIVADMVALYPEKIGRISAINGVYGLAGATISYILAGAVFPISKTDHTFYFITILLTIFSNIALVTNLPPTVHFQKGQDKLMKDAAYLNDQQGVNNSIIVPKNEEDETIPENSCVSEVGQVGYAWAFTTQYMVWRRVVLSRTLYFMAGGTFSALMLFYIYDCTDAKNPSNSLNILGMISLTGSVLVAYPAGILIDKFGAFIFVLLAGICMGAFFIVMSSSDTMLPIFLAIPFYGVAQQLYNVADLSMIINSLPNPRKKSRDLGGWSAIEYIGAAIGSVLAGVIISLDGKGDETVSESRDDDDFVDDKMGKRTVYTRFGYSTVFYPAAFFMILASLILYPIREQLKTKTKTDYEKEEMDQDGEFAPSLCQAETHAWLESIERNTFGDSNDTSGDATSNPVHDTM